MHLALLHSWSAEDAEVRAMLALYRTMDAAARIPLGFALGKIYDDLGEIDRSFAYYDAANAAHRATLDFSLEQTAARFDAIRTTFTPELFARFAGSGIASVQPIFIVGMPRSGSTLTEQILASHPAVLGGGEINLLDRVEGTMLQGGLDFAAFLDRTAPPALADWALAYLTPIRQAMGGKTRFTDKNLDNFHRIGLIRLLFPNAKIVHCTRNPLDTCLSIYRRLFAADNVPFGYDQTELGSYYRLYQRVMQHWDEMLPGWVYDHSYETLIDEPESSMRRLLAFCGLDWTPQALEFHKTERGVATASATQVRKPLYGSSVGSSDPYRPYLGPLIDALALQGEASGVSNRHDR